MNTAAKAIIKDVDLKIQMLTGWSVNKSSISIFGVNNARYTNAGGRRLVNEDKSKT